MTVVLKNRLKKFRTICHAGADNIGPRLVKAVADEIVDPLYYLFSLSFLTGVVPNTLKIAKVILIYTVFQKSNANIQITITTAHLIRISYLLSSFNYRLFWHKHCKFQRNPPHGF